MTRRRGYDWPSGKPGCREFRGPRDKHGYGMVPFGTVRPGRTDRRQIRLHRWVMEQYLGRKLRRTEEVCHTCDNPPCFLFAHLYVGAHIDNMADATAKGRMGPGERAVRGSAHYHAKLTEEQVREIWALKGRETSVAVAPRYGVGHRIIRGIWLRQSWRHVTDPLP